jgi:teichoic acid ribitol-phosphate primase
MLLRARFVQTGFALGRTRPLRRRVVLATNHAAELAGNLAEIRDGLQSAAPDIPVVVLANRSERGWWGAVRAAIDGVVAGWHLATARLFVVDDYYFPMYVIRPRAGTMRVQVWHASGAFKRFGYSVLDKSFGALEGRVGELAIHTNYDLCLVSAARFAPAYAEAFRQPLERFSAVLGIPRTDLFFDRERMAAASAAVRAAYDIPPGKRIILYAPTFRGTRITEARSPGQLDLAELRRSIGADHVVLVRSHPFVRTRQRLDPGLDGFAIDVSGWPSLDELMLVSDVLVTDYSSAIYEFSLLERPIAFFAPDREAYERERGFYLDYRSGLPGPVFEATAPLADYLRAGEFDLARVRRFRGESFDVADGRATERVIDQVIRATLDA